MIEIVKIVKLEKLGDLRLRLRFSDGSEGERDFADIVGEGGPMVEPLRDVEFFNRVFLEYGTLAWPNGFDLDSIALHRDMQAAGQLRQAA